MERPSSFPFSSGITSAMAFAAPVLVGIMERFASAGTSKVAVRLVLQALIIRIAVNGCHQSVFYAKLLCSTFTTGARQFVVQDPMEIILCFVLS